MKALSHFPVGWRMNWINSEDVESLSNGGSDSVAAIQFQPEGFELAGLSTDQLDFELSHEDAKLVLRYILALHGPQFFAWLPLWPRALLLIHRHIHRVFGPAREHDRTLARAAGGRAAHVLAMDGSLEHRHFSVRRLDRRGQRVGDRTEDEVRDLLPLFEGKGVFIGHHVVEDDGVGPIVVEINAADVGRNANAENPGRVVQDPVIDVHLVFLVLLSN